MKAKKGQVSIEFLLIMGFAMLMSLPLIFVFFKQSENLNTDVAAKQVEKVASEVRDAADEVYYLGSPSKKTVTVYMPRNIDSVTISGNSISFNLSTPQGRMEVVKWSVANFSSSSFINPGPGVHRISIEAGTYSVLVTDS